MCISQASKVCKYCGLLKPLDSFDKRSKSRGFWDNCKDCAKSYSPYYTRVVNDKKSASKLQGSKKYWSQKKTISKTPAKLSNSYYRYKLSRDLGIPSKMVTQELIDLSKYAQEIKSKFNIKSYCVLTTERFPLNLNCNARINWEIETVRIGNQSFTFDKIKELAKKLS